MRKAIFLLLLFMSLCSGNPHTFNLSNEPLPFEQNARILQVRQAIQSSNIYVSNEASNNGKRIDVTLCDPIITP